MQESIKKLSPSGARLLLSYLVCKQGDSMDDVIVRSGISEYKTFVKAKSELIGKGILEQQGDALYLIRDRVQL